MLSTHLSIFSLISPSPQQRKRIWSGPRNPFSPSRTASFFFSSQLSKLSRQRSSTQVNDFFVVHSASGLPFSLDSSVAPADTNNRSLDARRTRPRQTRASLDSKKKSTSIRSIDNIARSKQLKQTYGSGEYCMRLLIPRLSFSLCLSWLLH